MIGPGIGGWMVAKILDRRLHMSKPAKPKVKLTKQLCVKKLQEFISELDIRSVNEGQSYEDWLECLEQMTDHLQKVTALATKSH